MRCKFSLGAYSVFHNYRWVKRQIYIKKRAKTSSRLGQRVARRIVKEYIAGSIKKTVLKMKYISVSEMKQNLGELHKKHQ